MEVDNLRGSQTYVKQFISVFKQLDAQNLFHNKFYFMPLHVSSTCAHHQEVKIALHSLWYHHTCRCDEDDSVRIETCRHNTIINIIKFYFISVFNQLDAQNLFRNEFYFMPLHVSSTCAHHQEVKIALHSLWYHHTCRWPHCHL